MASLPAGFEILNPSHIGYRAIWTRAKELEFEFTIARGRGYVPADENKPTDQVFGQIAIDAIYTPIKNVKYSIENTRVEQKTDYEKLGAGNPDRRLDSSRRKR